jgi:hypothetical protein
MMNPWYMYSTFVYPDWGHLHSISYDPLIKWLWPRKIQSKTAFIYWCLLDDLHIEKPVTYIRFSSYAFGLSTFTKRQGAYVGYQKEPCERSSPEAGRSAVVARTVRACAESVRVPNFSRDLLPKTAGLTRKTV